MTQYGRPDSDVANPAGWTYSEGSTLFGCIDEATRADADFISTAAGTTGYCEVGLSSVTDPETSSDHDINYAYRRSNGAKSGTLRVSLRQGSSTEIAYWEHVDPGTSFVEGNQTLTTGQADSITDYTDLRLRFDATVNQNPGTIEVSWAEFNVPDAAGAAGAPPPRLRPLRFWRK